MRRADIENEMRGNRIMTFKNIRRYGYALVSALALSCGIAYAGDTYQLNISSQDLDLALKEFARQSGLQVVYYSKMAKGQASRPVYGELTAAAALTQLLENTGLTFSEVDQNTISIQTANTQYEQGKNNQPTKIQDKTREKVLEEMIVTAQKREQSVFDVPISIVALGERDIEERKISTFDELGMAVPGLTVRDNGSYERNVYIRGVSNSTGRSSTVGIYLDEVSITGAFSYQQLDARFYDIERVEVLRGPQGTLYGEGSMGGTVRFITKKPQLDHFGTSADVATMFTQDGSPSQQIRAMANIPLKENVFGLRVAATFENMGGWIDQPAAGQSDINDQDLVNIRVKGLWHPTESLALDMMTIIHRNDLGSPNMGEDEDGNFTQTFGLTTTASSTDDYELYNLTLTYDFDTVQLLSTSSHINTSRVLTEFGNFVHFPAPPAPPYDILSGPIGFDPFTLKTRVFNQELRLSSTGSGPWNWTAGAFYRRAKADFFQLALLGIHVPGSSLPDPLGPFDERGEYTSWAVFGDTSYELTERLELGVGLRYFEDDRKFSDDDLSNPIPISRQAGKFDSVNPRFYTNYAVSDDVMMYASVAKGFRSGGFNTDGFPAFGPESLWNYEIGTKMSLLDGSLDAEFALYYSDYTDYQISGIPSPPQPPFTLFFNGGDVTIKGIDWGFTWHANDNLTFIFNGDYVDATFDNIDAILATHQAGDRLDNAPDYSFTLSANYDFIWKGKPGFARLDYNQRGRSLYKRRDIGLHTFASSGVNNMFNAHVGLEWNDNFTFGVFAQNLLNDRDLMDPNATLGRAARSRPRTIGIEFGVEFD